jgi:hypothetical protein
MTDRPINRRLAVPGQDPEEDRLLAMIAGLASELAVTRERLDTLERLTSGTEAVEAFAPDAAAIGHRDTLRRRIIARVFRPLRDAAARAAAGGDAL